MNDPMWRDHAACRGESTAPWFPDISRGRAGNRPAFHTALGLIDRYCHRCPVIDTCGQEADRTDAVGVWAGTLRYKSRRVNESFESSYVLTAAVLRARLANEPDPEPAADTTDTECRWCRTPRSLRGDGRVRGHDIPGTNEICRGSGEPPAGEQVA